MSKRYGSYNVTTGVYFMWNSINAVLIWATFNRPIGAVDVVIVVILRNLWDEFTSLGRLRRLGWFC